jgi:hypothetical protein
MDSRVISRVSVGPGQKEAVLGHTIHPLMSIFEGSQGVVGGSFKTKPA